jgi:hypothetical protein
MHARGRVCERARPLSYSPLVAGGLVEQSNLGVRARAQRPRESEEKFIDSDRRGRRERGAV